MRAIPVVITPYDPDLPVRADTLASALKIVGPVLIAVHHIGSTAVPGLAAKPIIDLTPVVRGLDAFDLRRPLVEALGCRWHGENGIPGRRYCVLDDAVGGRMAQLHVFTEISPDLRRHLAFRDYLRAHPDVARAYADEKSRAQRLHPDNSHRYSDEKSAWVRRVEALALEWPA